jgi:ABC-2 type transport system permease protein
MKRLLAHPLIVRELLVRLRGRASFTIAALYILILIGVATAFWPSGDMMRGDMGFDLFKALSAAVIALSSLVAGVLSSTSIVSEREADTLDDLKVTLLSPAKVVLDKLISSIAFVMILIVAGMPAFGLCFMLGGVQSEQLYAFIVLALFTSVVWGMTGLFCSSVFRKTYMSVLLFLFVLIFISVLGYLLMVYVDYYINFAKFNITTNEWGTSVSFSRKLFLYAACVFSFASPLVQCTSGIEGLSGSGRFVPPFLALSITWIGQFSLFYILTLVFYRRPEKNKRKVKAIIENKQELERRRKRFPYYLIDPRRKKPPIPDLGNPITHLEARTQLIGRTTSLLRKGYMLLVISFGAAWLLIIRESDREENSIAIMIIWIILLLFTVPFSASAVSDERSRRTWDLLRTSSVSSAHIIKGKFKICMRFALVAVVCGMGGIWLYCMMYYWENSSIYSFERHLAFMIAPVLIYISLRFFTALGVYLSTIFKKSISAILTTYVIGLVLYLGVPFGFAVLLRSQTMDESIFRVLVFVLSGPLILMVWVAENPNWIFLPFLIHVIIYLAVPSLLLYRAQKRIDKIR